MSTTDRYRPTARTTATRHQDRISYDRSVAHAILDEATLCHVGFVIDGQPVVLPQLHARVGDQLFLHGSSGARALQRARDGGLSVCVTATIIDGLVLARSAFSHSINYRSVVIHGMAEEVTDDKAKQAALSWLVEAVVPGRSAAVRGPSRKELAATTVLQLPLDDVSVKTRTGPPADDEADLASPYWAGVLPLSSVPGVPEPAPDLANGIPTPSHVAQWKRA
jgi:nitroimidazol reductase NimA-like FMN-containing flavoprotein (pyridoxamine 5'-phosphate oxidase superfamily)